MMGVGKSRCLSMAAVAVLVALLSVLGGPAFAQGAGEVTGRVRNGDGQPLEGVEVRLIKAGQEANQQQTSDAQGNFRFDRLASGVYIAAASREGYAEVTCPGVRIVSGLARSLSIKLMPAEGEQPSSCEAVTQ